MKAYILTENDVKLLEVQWTAAKDKILAKDSQDTNPHDIFRTLNYVLYNWIVDTLRK